MKFGEKMDVSDKPLPAGCSEDLRPLLEPYMYLADKSGKQVRSALIRSFNYWLRVPPEAMAKIEDIVQMLHNASLLIDDIEDNGKLRRGQPVSHLIYGIPTTLNCGNFVYFLAMQQLQTLGKPEAYQIFVEELINLHRGQGFDIYWRDNHICPTEDQYKQMVLDKTGGLFKLAVRLMQLFSESKSDFNPLLDYLGLYFQIRDDYINLQSEEYMTNKSYCEDLTEGKYSFPVIHAIMKNPRDTRLSKILAQRTEDHTVKLHAVEYMKSQGSFEYTQSVMTHYYEAALTAIAGLGGNDHLSQMMEQLKNRLV